MERADLNQNKREEIAGYVEGLEAKGFKRGELAAVLGVTSSTILRMSKAETMGTNAQRAELHDMLADPIFASVATQKALEDARAREKTCAKMHRDACAQLDRDGHLAGADGRVWYGAKGTALPPDSTEHRNYGIDLPGQVERYASKRKDASKRVRVLEALRERLHTEAKVKAAKPVKSAAEPSRELLEAASREVQALNAKIEQEGPRDMPDAECSRCGARYFSGEGHPTVALCPKCDARHVEINALPMPEPDQGRALVEELHECRGEGQPQPVAPKAAVHGAEHARQVLATWRMECEHPGVTDPSGRFPQITPDASLVVETRQAETEVRALIDDYNELRELLCEVGPVVREAGRAALDENAGEAADFILELATRIETKLAKP